MVDAALRLFATEGFEATTVGDIEQAVGLVPRRGALYRHFESKEALLETAVRRKVSEREQLRTWFDLLPIGDLRAELTLLCRFLLVELENQRDLIATLEQVGQQRPELVDMYWSRVHGLTYEQAAELARRHFENEPPSVEVDVAVLAAVVVGAVVGFRRSRWTFDRSPLDLDDDRFVDGLVQLLAGPFEALLSVDRQS